MSYARYVAHYIEAAAAPPAVEGTIATSFGPFVVTITGAHGVSGTVVTSFGPFTTSVTAVHGVSGTVTTTIGPFIASIDGTHGAPPAGASGTITTTLGPFTVSIAGTHTPPAVTGTIAATIGAFVASITALFGDVAAPTVRGRLRLIPVDDGRRRMEPHVFHASLGDALVPQSTTIADAFGPVDMSAAATITFRAVGRRTGRVISGAATGDANGLVEWELTGDHLDPAEGAEVEEYALHVTATWADGTVLTWPTPGAGRLTLDSR